MALTESIRKTDREVLPDSCIHRATGRVHEPGKDVATGCRMWPEGRAMEAGQS